MEFFGVPVSDQMLLEARADEVLAICKRFVDRGTYKSHFDILTRGNEEKVLQSFFEALAGMRSEVQDEIFEALVSELQYSHVVERLNEGTVYT